MTDIDSGYSACVDHRVYWPQRQDFGGNTYFSSLCIKMNRFFLCKDRQGEGVNSSIFKSRVREIDLNLQSLTGHFECLPDIFLDFRSLDILSNKIKPLHRTFFKKVRQISHTLNLYLVKIRNCPKILM